MQGLGRCVVCRRGAEDTASQERYTRTRCSTHGERCMALNWNLRAPVRGGQGAPNARKRQKKRGKGAFHLWRAQARHVQERGAAGAAGKRKNARFFAVKQPEAVVHNPLEPAGPFLQAVLRVVELAERRLVFGDQRHVAAWIVVSNMGCSVCMPAQHTPPLPLGDPLPHTAPPPPPPPSRDAGLFLSARSTRPLRARLLISEAPAHRARVGRSTNS